MCGDAGLDVDPDLCVAPSGEAGRLCTLFLMVGAVAGRLRRRELFPWSFKMSVLALTGPPERNAFMPRETVLLPGITPMAGVEPLDTVLRVPLKATPMFPKAAAFVGNDPPRG